MSTMRQHFHPSSAKNIFRKQKSIDLNDKPVSEGKKLLRKQSSVDHVTSGLKHASITSAPINLSNILWRNSTQSLNEPNLRIPATSAAKKRAQFASSNINSSVLSKQDLLTDCLTVNKTMKSVGEGTKTRVNINIFLSQDIHDGSFSDNEGANHAENQAPNKTSANSSNASSKAVGNLESTAAASGRLSVSARRAQFQASRRIMSAPIRPMNIEDPKNKRKVRKKKVIRVNLTLNRDKDEPDDSPDDSYEDTEPRKLAAQTLLPKAPSKSKQLTTRSRSVLGCDQIGIETLVSMLSSGGSDSEKDEAQQQAQATPPKTDGPKNRTNMLRKTVSFQDDDSFLQPTINKDSFGNRRHSNVPFAGRIRNTRSLFGQEISNLYLPINNDQEKPPEIKDANKLESPDKVKDEKCEAEKPKIKKTSEGSSNEKKSQDNQTPKEQECWRLYEKMKKTGLNVSYDTILRGILKPSELRLLEKQKKYLGDINEKSVEETETPQQEPQKVN